MAEQVLQALALPEADAPAELLQNRESTLCADFPQSGHLLVKAASLIGLISSNFCLQFEQRYSYIGIAPPFQTVRPQPLP